MAKLVAVFATAFWRERGLSGRIASQVGPIVEAHDHCGEALLPAALTGFIGWPAHMRAQICEAALIEAVRAQLANVFGANAPAPIAIHIADWSRERFTATEADRNGPMSHPNIAPAAVRALYWDGQLCFAGAECAALSPGLLEGALAAAEYAVSHFR